MSRGVAQPPELRAKVVAELLAGSGSIGEVARKYGVQKSTAATWLGNDAPEHDAAAADTDRMGKRWDALGEKLLDLVEALNQALIRQCEVMGSPDWVARQTAEDMALLVEALNERQIRVLSGFHPKEDT